MTDKERIKYLESQVDFLSRNYVTGLEGRHRFMQKLRQQFAKDEIFYLVMHDVDGLHEVNRLRGYACGDRLLREVANDLKMCPEPCCVFHIGGDEFYVIYKDEPADITCQNTTSAVVLSSNFNSVDEMLDEVDELLSAKKIKLKKRRRDDI